MNTVVMKTAFAHWNLLFTKDELTSIDEYIIKNIPPTSGRLANAEEEKPEIRKSSVHWVARNPETDWIFARINGAGQKLNSHFFGFDLWPVSSLQYTIYEDEGNHYTWHQDIHIDTGLQDLNVTHQRKLSLVLLCQKCEEGGALELLTSDTPTVPLIEEGSAVVFPSFTLHRVTPVTKGVRKTMVAWFEGPEWR